MTSNLNDLTDRKEPMVEQPRRRKPGRPTNLNAGVIVAAAIALIDETGMLRLADVGARLGIDVSALYRYFHGRGDLVSAIADSLTAPLRTELPATGDWRVDAEAQIRRIETCYREHPSVTSLVMAEAELSGPSLQVVADGARLLQRSGAPDGAVFTALHAIEVAVFGSITYDSFGGPAADEVRRSYHRQVGVFDVDSLFPTPERLAAESSESLWISVHGILDWLERQAATDD